jgi:release factor glutamine methyltransferase
VPKTLGSLVVEAAAALSAAGFPEPRRQARRLVASALAISQADLLGKAERALDDGQVNCIRAILCRSLAREPLSRILGQREFWGLEFALSADTLDPRPETETVVEAVLGRNFDRRATLRFLDLGTGTGCLLLALLSEFPLASGVGIDIAEGAVRTAKTNAEKLGFADRAGFVTGDWGTAVSGRFDAIVANPPYIESGALALLPQEVASHDPPRALDGGPDGLSEFRAIAEQLPELLVPGGIFATEVGAGQAGAVAVILAANFLVLDGIEKDLAGIARCVIARPEPIRPGGSRPPKAKNGWNAARSRLGWSLREPGAAAESG